MEPPGVRDARARGTASAGAQCKDMMFVSGGDDARGSFRDR